MYMYFDEGVIHVHLLFVVCACVCVKLVDCITEAPSVLNAES